MKNKTHKISWTMSLCAVAVFSLAATRDARAEAISFTGSEPSPEPVPVTERTMPPRGIEPVPAPAPSTDSYLPVYSGSFSGTIMAD